MAASRTAVITAPRVRQLVEEILPTGQKVRVGVREIGEYAVIEVVTKAWKSRPLIDRILKVDGALRKGLSASQSDRILRVAVMTPEEEKELIRRSGSMKPSPKAAGTGRSVKITKLKNQSVQPKAGKKMAG
jgi:hypothetical protein